jgi:ferredoxin-NADP reductase
MPLEHAVRVRTVDRLSPRTCLVRVEPGRPFPFYAGQSVWLGLATQDVRRPYSLASGPAESRKGGAVDLLIGLGAGGEWPRHLEGVTAGSIVSISQPAGRFVLPPGLGGRSLLLLGGGTGIAPLRAMAYAALDRPRPPRLDIVYSARTPEELVFQDEFLTWQANGHAGYHATVTRDAPESWTGRRGRIDREWLDGILGPTPVCMLCGPAPFVAHMKAELGALGVRPSSVHHEVY